MAVQIEVISDVVCPWCFIGKRRLEAALHTVRERGTAEVEVTWLPFQLNPDMPEDGIDRAEYLRRKFGSNAAQIYQRVSTVGESVGIDFDFARVQRQPNTLSAHQLIALAHAQGSQDAMVERLFRAYFLEGADLTREEVLVQLAADAALDPEAARADLRDVTRREAVREADASARSMGVEGVPFFVFDRRLAISGAHEPQTLVQAIERAAQGLG